MLQSDGLDMKSPYSVFNLQTDWDPALIRDVL